MPRRRAGPGAVRSPVASDGSRGSTPGSTAPACGRPCAATTAVDLHVAYGPFADEAAFRGWLAERRDLEDPLFLRILDAAGRAARDCGADGDPPRHARDRGRPYRALAGAAALGARRPKRNISSRAMSSRRSATGAMNGNATPSMRPRAGPRCALGFTFEGIFRQPHDHQGPQPRHRLVRHARRRLARAQARLRTAGSIRKISMAAADRKFR